MKQKRQEIKLWMNVKAVLAPTLHVKTHQGMTHLGMKHLGMTLLEMILKIIRLTWLNLEPV
jgi:hypothetical protein